MNKSLIFIVFVLISFNCFSQEEKYGDFEFFTGMPVIYGILDYDGIETINTGLSFSFGMGASNYNIFNDKKFGIVFSGNLIFPGKFIHGVKGKETHYKTSIDFFLLDMMFGVGYRLYENNKFRFPVTFGLHSLSLSGTTKSSASDTHELFKWSFGISSSIAVQFNINQFVYFFTRLHGTFDFLSYTKHIVYTGINVGGKMAYFIDGKDFFALSAYFGITPVLGIGLKMDAIHRKKTTKNE